MVLVMGSLTACATSASSSAGPPPYLLVLGDSLSTGYQPAGGGDPTCADSALDKSGHGGWACILLTRLRATDSSYTFTNFAVNGEDTCGFMTGKTCDGKPIGGSLSQQRQARDFLQSHAENNGIITIDIGADDATVLENQARQGNNTAVMEQLPEVFARAALNYRRILRRLHQLAPKQTIIALGYYIPNLPNFIPQDILPVAQVAIDALARTFNANIVVAARQYHATYVDLFHPFQGRQAQLLVPGDIHPNDAGQRLIAQLVWQAYKKHA